jgi:hypothetical protein
MLAHDACQAQGQRARPLHCIASLLAHVCAGSVYGCFGSARLCCHTASYSPVYAVCDKSVFGTPFSLDVMCEVVLSGDLQAGGHKPRCKPRCEYTQSLRSCQASHGGVGQLRKSVMVPEAHHRCFAQELTRQDKSQADERDVAHKHLQFKSMFSSVLIVAIAMACAACARVCKTLHAGALMPKLAA